MILESLRMASQTLLRRKLRSFLTILGVVIGVAAIIALISMVGGVMGVISRKFYGLGAGKLTIRIPGSELRPGITQSELLRLGEIPCVTGLSPSITTRGSVIIGGKTAEDVTLLGKNSRYFTEESPAIPLGRALSPLDDSRQSRVCLISRSLMGKYCFGENPLSQSIWVGGQQYRIIGVTGKPRAVDAAFYTGEDTVILPYEALGAMEGKPYISAVELYLADPTGADDVQKQAETILDGIFHGREGAYTVTSMESLRTVMDELSTLMELLLFGIASISLIVGGIGIMNMMLVSVSERQMEIGLKKALGAPPGVIRLQFLLESVILSLLGGILGVGLGILCTYGASLLIGVPCGVSIRAILLGVGFSALIGILFGYAPAKSASRLNPIDALRTR